MRLATLDVWPDEPHYEIMLEYSWVNGSVDARGRFINLDPDHPVQKDAFLPLVHVEVETWVTEPEKATSRVSNQFYFTFAIVRHSPTRHVLPGTQDEARRMVQRMLSDEEQAASDDYEI